MLDARHMLGIWHRFIVHFIAHLAPYRSRAIAVTAFEGVVRIWGVNDSPAFVTDDEVRELF